MTPTPTLTLKHADPAAPARIASLDALRGLAALAVMLFHYTSYAHSQAPDQTFYLPIPWGHYGVQLFFIISGFVILMTARRCRTVGEFAFSRFARLYPAYWAACAFTYILVQLAVSASQPAYLNAFLNLFMIKIPGVGRIESIHWTLQEELWFYLVIAGVVAMRQTNKILWFIAALVVTSLLGLQFTRWFSLFLTGMVIFDSREGFQRKHALLLSLCTADVLGRSLLLGTKDVAGWQYPVAVLVCALTIAAATRWRASFLNNRILLYLGTISYSLYLIHATLGSLIVEHLVKERINVNVAVLVAVAASLSVASAITFLIERPALKKLRSARPVPESLPMAKAA